MLKTIKYQLRGAVYGSLITMVVMGFILYPHTTFRIQASNQPPEQQLAMDQSAVLAAVMPQVKPLPPKAAK